MDKKELKHIVLAIFLMSLVLSFFNPTLSISYKGIIQYLIILLFSAIIISVWVLGKKLVAKKIYLKIEHSIWKFQRYNIAKNRKFKKPVPMGLILPIILSIISRGTIRMLTLLQFDATPLPERTLKNRGKKTWKEITEWDLALVVFYGFISLLVLSLISSYFGAVTLAKYSIYFILWNMVPFGQLDGLKLFLGSAGPLKGNPIPLLYLFTLILVGLTSVIVFF